MFQFTHPLRGETYEAIGYSEAQSFQFTHPLRGETFVACSSIHNQRFQFTHPLRGETYRNGLFDNYNGVSIHSPLAG